MDIDELSSWVIPSWHPDFGDPKIEFTMLVNFCRELISNHRDYKLKLDTFEEGYMNVEIYRSNDEKFGELVIVELDDGKVYGLFYDMDDDEKEVYFSSIKDGLKYFQ